MSWRDRPPSHLTLQPALLLSEQKPTLTCPLDTWTLPHHPCSAFFGGHPLTCSRGGCPLPLPQAHNSLRGALTVGVLSLWGALTVGCPHHGVPSLWGALTMGCPHRGVLSLWGYPHYGVLSPWSALTMRWSHCGVLSLWGTLTVGVLSPWGALTMGCPHCGVPSTPFSGASPALWILWPAECRANTPTSELH